MRHANGLRAFAMTATLGLTASYSPAAVLFHNTGTTSGWSRVFVEHRGSVAQVASPAFKGSTAIRVTQVFDPAYRGRYHSELVRDDGYKPGQMRFYGFALYIPSNWQSVSQGFNIAQFIADFSDTGCDDFMPSTMMWFTGSSLSTRVKQGSICNQSIRTFSNFASLSYGQWHRIEIQANWRSDSAGYLKVWVDGAKRLQAFGLDTTILDPQSRTFSFRVGMYANSWRDQGRMVGTQATRTLYYDQIGIGTTFRDADPNAW